MLLKLSSNCNHAYRLAKTFNVFCCNNSFNYSDNSNRPSINLSYLIFFKIKQKKRNIVTKPKIMKFFNIILLIVISNVNGRISTPNFFSQIRKTNLVNKNNPESNPFHYNTYRHQNHQSPK